MVGNHATGEPPVATMLLLLLAFCLPVHAAADAPPNKAIDVKTGAISRRPQDAAEILEFFDVDVSLLRQLVDHRPLVEEEEEAIVRVLFALPNLPPQDVERWSQQQPDWNAVIAAPQDYRTHIYRLQGNVTQLDRVPLIPEAAERFGFSHYYRATVELGADHWQAIVCTRDVPQAWRAGEPIDEAVSFYGMFLKLGDRPVFAARRLAWHPNRVDEKLGVKKAHVFLGDLGMDIGLWDDVNDGDPLVASDRECFYQLLSALGRTQREHLRERATGKLDVVELLKSPKRHHGELMSVDGTARRATRVEVDDPDVQARFGIDHYYEIDIVVHLDRPIAYKKPDGETLTYNRFPVVCAVRELPPGMPEGEEIRQRVVVPAVFFKVWAYHARKMNDFNEDARQRSPLLVGLAPDVYRSESIYSPYVSAIAGGLFVVALLGVWIGVWRYGVGDARFQRETLKKHYEVEEGKSLNDLGIEAKAGPDFRHLE